ncbi:uncharacterized protein LOC131171148 [Hevea brasiliensis]|uniref:uncharacterized protein LOC131171148 n=1 Tax=Hevea brasiliensis TaxID=3981 RepID=UPI0025F2BC5A|nr:uncharacterized protein LOC131171148 [Hevea brasiliensis]
MTHALIAKKKLGFIDGSIKMPSSTEQPTEFEKWNQCNSMILSWISHSVEPDIASGLMNAETAKQVWDDLRDQFSQKNAAAIFQIQKAIATITQGTMSVAAYYIKIKALWDELEIHRTPVTCNRTNDHQTEREEDKLMQFLMGLNDPYKIVRSNILLMKPLPNVRQAYSMIIQEKTQQQIGPSITENFFVAAVVQSRSVTQKGAKEKFCEHCNRSGHNIDECRKLKYHCKFCDNSGHTEDRCRLKKANQNARSIQSSNNRTGGRSANAVETTIGGDNSTESSGFPVNFTNEQLQKLAQLCDD